MAETRQRSKTGRKARTGTLKCPNCGYTFEVVSGYFTDEEWEDICTCPTCKGNIRMTEVKGKR